MIREWLIAVIALLVAAAAQADSAFYYGAHLHDGDLELESGAGLTTTGLDLRLGREFGKWLAVELRVASSSDQSDTLLRDPEVRTAAALLKLNLPFERVNLYLVGGAPRTNVDLTGVDADLDDVAAGVGLDLFGSPRTALTIELMRYGSAPDTFDAVGIGLLHRFDWPALR